MVWSNPWAFLGLLALPLILGLGRRRMRESHSWLGRVALAFRAAFFLFLLAALARPALLREERRADWLFLLDRSDSMTPADRDWSRAFVREGAVRVPPGDRIGVISFGENAVLDVPLGGGLEGEDWGRSARGGATRLDEALRAALAELPGLHRQHLVLLSDGIQTAGDAREALAALARAKVRLFAAAPDPASRVGEMALEELILPASAKPGDGFTVRAVVACSRSTLATLRLSRDGAPLAEYRVQLHPGHNLFQLDQVAKGEGLSLFRAEIEGAGDLRGENNALERFLEVRGGARVLLVSEDEAHSRPLVEVADAQGLLVRAVDQRGLPDDPQELRAYDVVVFDNVPAVALSSAQQRAVATYVEVYGGGFVTLGGDRSYGNGGYHQTALEPVLPVDTDVTNQAKIPLVALVLVIDTSDSMGGGVAGASGSGSKLEIAKLASYSAVERLNPRDMVGLVSFDTAASWPVPMTQARRQKEISARLALLMPSGGTDLYVGLQAAIDYLRGVRAYKKHVILLSDGLTPFRRFDTLLEGAVADRITLTTVTLGYWGDKMLMSRLAEWGKGRNYYTNTAKEIPRIFTKETLVVSRNLAADLEIRPKVLQAHEILAGIDPADLPPLHGYAITAPKPSAEVILATPDQEPLLAVRHHGLGRSVAFTSDLATAWGREWVRWRQFPRVVTQMIRWAERRAAAGHLELAVRAEGEWAEIVADLFDHDGHYLNRIPIEGRVTAPDRSTFTVPLAQSAPGRYRGGFPLAQAGDYRLTVAGRDGDSPTFEPRTTGLAVPYAAEYRNLVPDTGLLTQLAQGTGGALLPREGAVERLVALTTHRKGERSAIPLWPYLVVAGLLCFLLDIATRQLVWLPRRKEGRP